MEPRNQISQEMLDRLVDGELDEQHRRDVIEALQCDEDGWQRCAIAFLESQSFQEAIRGVDVERGADAGGDVPIQRNQGRVRGGRSGLPPKPGTLIAMAACLLIAFTLGTRSSLNSTDPVATSEIVPSDAVDSSPQLVGNRYPDIWSGESALSSDLENELEQMGLHVNRQIGFMPAFSSDGSPMIVPYEDLQIHPAHAAPQ